MSSSISYTAGSLPAGLRLDAAHRIGDSAGASHYRLQGDLRLRQALLTGIVELRHPGSVDKEGDVAGSVTWIQRWNSGTAVTLTANANQGIGEGEFGTSERRVAGHVRLHHALGAGLSTTLSHRTARHYSGQTPIKVERYWKGSIRLRPLSGGHQWMADLSLQNAESPPQGAWALRAATTVGGKIPLTGGFLDLRGGYRFAKSSEDGAERTVTASARIGLDTSLGGRVDLGLNVAHDLLGGEGTSGLSAAYSAMLGNDTLIKASVEREWIAGGEEWTAKVEVRHDFHLPLPVPVRGRLEGRVLPAYEGMDVEGLLVRVGNEYTITDAAGRFVFPALLPGEYTVSLERVPTGMALAVDPISVRIEAGRRADVLLELVRMGEIEGTVRIEGDFGVWGPPPSPSGIRVMVLEDGATLTSTVTDSGGNFRLSQLLPGRYTVLIDKSTLPKSVTMKVGSADVLLVDSARAELQLEVVAPPIEFVAVAPNARFAYTPASPQAGESVRFVDQSTVDFTRTFATVQWDFGDGHIQEGREAVHMFAQPGSYRVRLTVTDSAGESATLERILLVE